MPGAGTDKTKNWVAAPAPVVILVEPQLGDNIGAAARVMANFGLSRLRLVNPVQGWPNERAKVLASGADRVLDQAELFPTLKDAIADCQRVFATTARAHDQAKPVHGAGEAAAAMATGVAAGERVAIVFGRERIGLENDEVALADAIVTLPVNPAFASLNLAQAVAVVSYEWAKAAATPLPFAMPQRSPPAQKQQLEAFMANIETALDRVEFFRPAEKRATMMVNLRNIFARMQPSQQDIQTLQGIFMAVAEGAKGPARGGVLDGGEAVRLRAIVAEAGEEGGIGRGPLRGLSRLLRRNPTDAERAVWDILTKDPRFSGRGFKRQTPVGPHLVDFVSFPLRLAVLLVPPDGPDAHRDAHAAKRAWLAERRYQVVDMTTPPDAAALEALAEAVAQAAQPPAVTDRL